MATTVRKEQGAGGTSVRKEQGAGGKTGRREGTRELGPELLAPTAAFRRPSGVVEPYRRESGWSRLVHVDCKTRLESCVIDDKTRLR